MLMERQSMNIMYIDIKNIFILIFSEYRKTVQFQCTFLL